MIIIFSYGGPICVCLERKMRFSVARLSSPLSLLWAQQRSHSGQECPRGAPSVGKNSAKLPGKETCIPLAGLDIAGDILQRSLLS